MLAAQTVESPVWPFFIKNNPLPATITMMTIITELRFFIIFLLSLHFSLDSYVTTPPAKTGLAGKKPHQ
jgi:hypothetical protein